MPPNADHWPCELGQALNHPLSAVARVRNVNKGGQYLPLIAGVAVCQVDMSMPRDVSRGVNSVKRYVRQHDIRGVHGTLIELIECMPQLHTAVEVGHLLFKKLRACLASHRANGDIARAT